HPALHALSLHDALPISTPSRPGLRSLPLPTLAVSCNCAPELPSTERTKTSCTLLSYLTALSRHTRILLRDSAIDRLASPLPNQIDRKSTRLNSSHVSIS